MPIYSLNNQVQNYSWGTYDAIPNLLGIKNPSRKPFAELWMGAHSKAPSVAKTPEGEVPLTELISKAPRDVLGAPVQERFGPALPFLFKVLSAAQPLSIQAHPSKRKAESGFEKENIAAVPLTASERNYRDPNHKPEMFVALEPFEGLCGFRPIKEVVRLARVTAPREYRDIVGQLESNPGKVELSVLFYRFITYSENQKRDILYFVERRISRVLEREQDPEIRFVLQWVQKLMAIFPGDIGALAPFLLNLFRLDPGQAVFIAPGQIHAYLKGTGLEIMANSDNVLRGALTSKHIDVPELLSTLSFIPGRVRSMDPVHVDETVDEYPSDAVEFRLDKLRLAEGRTTGRRKPGPEILLCLDGEIQVEDKTGTANSPSLLLRKGDCAFVTALTDRYELRGEGLAFRAGVNV